ncbi:MAG: SapC family protein [Gammaproteobacteria bacterium]|nr:SapC family protein [Gammaproteobacteria bacterium]
MSSILFYENPVGLNRELHKEVKIGTIKDYAFATKTNSVILAGVEFIEATKEYPIVFAKIGEDKLVPVALLGLRDNENLFIDESFKWDARYIPAFVRRYPFVLAESESGEMTVCVDEVSAAFNAEDGQALFDEKGENSQFLQNALDFLRNYQGEFIRTEAFVSKLNKLDLFTEMSAKAEMTDGTSFVMNGLMIIDEQKLLALDKNKVSELFKSGELAWVYAHLISLSNMGRLVDRIAARGSKE